MMRVNHSREFKSDDGACTNQAESWFSRLRRAEMGVHHRISGRYLYQYANEMAWREDHRREPERAAMAADHRLGPSPSEIGNLARILAAEGSMNVERPNTLAGLVEKARRDRRQNLAYPRRPATTDHRS